MERGGHRRTHAGGGTGRSVALAGFGLDSLIEIGASTVVLWELRGEGQDRQRRALRLIGGAFLALAGYLILQSTLVLATGHHSRHSTLGVIWTAITAAVMFWLAAGKARAGAALDNAVLRTEGRVTFVDGLLAAAILLKLSLDTLAGAWWADPLAGLVIVYYAILMNPVALWRRLVAEAIGSAFLAAVVVGSGIAAQQLSPGQLGLELLENAAATAVGLDAIILMVGPVSDAHLNPVVSFIDAALGGGISWRHAMAHLPA